LAGAVVATGVLQVLLQALDQGQHAFDPLVAGGQHLERRLKTRRWRAVAGQADLGQGNADGHDNAVLKEARFLS
jgi:hypothetical protein